ncbi:MAG: NlpC/P60 family protein [Bacteroidia bacterium]
MKLRLIILLLLVPLFLSAQNKKKKLKAKAPKKAMHEYYQSYSLTPDSAQTPYLYYKIYEWIGTRYQYSGTSKKGIDCSGFVAEMYGNVYCTPLPHGSTNIWTKVEPIEQEQLKEGDILFFKIKPNRISHVGIYLGNNKFAHASVRNGVMINDLNETYYKNTFYKAGRVNTFQ